MLQIILIICLALATCLVVWLLARSAARSKARRAFTGMMSDVHDWAIRRNDLNLTAVAMESLRQHRDLLRRAKLAGSEKGTNWQEREFLREYERCEARHQQICDLNYPDNDMYEQAMELQEAIDALDARRSSGTGGTGDD
jgi:hypothetical protein